VDLEITAAECPRTSRSACSGQSRVISSQLCFEPSDDRCSPHLLRTTAAASTGQSPSPLSKPHPPQDAAKSGPLVTLVKSGVAFHWSSRFHNLLEAAEACDVPVRWSCRSGMCHNCESGVISGELSYSRILSIPSLPTGLLSAARARRQMSN
jgi:hypothetical protein